MRSLRAGSGSGGLTSELHIPNEWAPFDLVAGATGCHIDTSTSPTRPPHLRSCPPVLRCESSPIVIVQTPQNLQVLTRLKILVSCFSKWWYCKSKFFGIRLSLLAHSHTSACCCCNSSMGAIVVRFHRRRQSKALSTPCKPKAAKQIPSRSISIWGTLTLLCICLYRKTQEGASRPRDSITFLKNGDASSQPGPLLGYNTNTHPHRRRF